MYSLLQSSGIGDRSEISFIFDPASLVSALEDTRHSFIGTARVAGAPYQRQKEAKVFGKNVYQDTGHRRTVEQPTVFKTLEKDGSFHDPSQDLA